MVYEPPAPDHEPHRVLIHKDEFIDEGRDGRIVPYKIYYPDLADTESLPVVIWSHGLGGGRDGAAFLARYMASNGYIVVNIQHVGTDTSLWEGKPGHPWDVIRATKIPRQASLDRFYDVPFVLDQLVNVSLEGVSMDFDRMGMSGHSFGALTTQIMAGQFFPDQDDQLTAIDEDRFKAGILYSFVPMKHLTDEDPAAIFGAMKAPLFFMTGTVDENPITGQDYTYRMPVYEHAGSPEKSLLVLDEGDHMVFAGSRGQLGDNPKRTLHEDIIKVTSLVWWDAYLKDDQDAKEWLTGEAISTYLKSEATYEYREHDG